MNVDTEGCFAIFIAITLGIFTLAGAALGAKLSYDRAVEEGKSGADLVWSTIGGGFLGACFGFAAGGLVVSISGAVVCVAASASTMLFGATAIQTFAVGALAYNLVGVFVAPILGVKMDLIETKPSSPQREEDIDAANEILYGRISMNSRDNQKMLKFIKW